MKSRWFITGYKGSQAHSVKSHAEAGIGYIVLEEAGSGQNFGVRAAFQLPDSAKVPASGRYASHSESQRFEKQFRLRSGMSEAVREYAYADTRAVVRQIENNLPHCKGQRSIQREINHIARSESPKGWMKLIADPEWRESIRLKLQKTTSEWCDNKAKTCYCDSSNSDQLPLITRQMADEIFPD